MNAHHFWRLLWPLLSALLFGACNDGHTVAGGGIGGTGVISTGTISSFGSIVVNGTRFDTSGAVVYVNGAEMGIGESVVQNQLGIGQVVTVEGQFIENRQTTVASKISYNRNVQGPVEWIGHLDSGTKKMAVLGQTVIVNTITKFAGTTIDAITRNDVVEVSGFRDHTGTIRATFVEKIGSFTTGLVYEVSGVVKNLNADRQIFAINDLVVNYTMADTNSLPNGRPANGLKVEVEGTLDVTGGTLWATVIQISDDVGQENADEVEITGFVTAVSSASEFAIGNQAIIINPGAAMIDGVLADIAPGVKLEAEGVLRNGIIYAHEIEFWGPDQIEVEGMVTEIVSASEFSVDERTVVTHADTVFEDGDPEDLYIGANVEIKGRLRGGVLVADKVSFENEE